LPPRVKEAVVLAAQTHDLGKRRQDWQRSIGNPNPQEWFAKSGAGWRPRDLGSYRHEFGSVLDLLDGEVFAAGEVGAEIRDLVLHLVGAHHGYGRPHFPDEYAVDSAEHTTIAAVSAAGEVPQRFARLQRRYGRWGLAYLESLLRAADYEASAHPAGTEVRQ